MSKTVKVILSTHGGRLTGQTKRELVEQALQEAGLDYDLALTDHPEHGIKLTHQAVQSGWQVIIAAGGDGTVNEVVNGLVQAAGEEEAGLLGVIPLGTANDFAHGLELPLDMKSACQRIAAGKNRLIDIGQVNDRYFANNSAVGLEAAVTVAHAQMRWLNGNARYIVAALKTIAKSKSWEMKITWPNGQYEGPASLVSVGNNRRTGGSFIMTPHAVPDDGLLDFTYSMNLSRLQLIHLLPKTFSGDHIHHPLVNYRQAPSLSIIASPPAPLHADGEVLTMEATEIHYRIIPHKLRVIV